MLRRLSFPPPQNPWMRAAIAVFIGLFIGFGILIATAPTQDQLLVPGQTGYVATGSFSEKGLPEMKRRTVREAKSRNSNISFWGSLGSTTPSTGTLTSLEFSAPPVLSVFMGGYPGTPGHSLALQRVDTREQLQLQVGRSGDRWVQLYWRIPKNWRGKPVKLIAIDASPEINNWIGISTPLKVNGLRVLQRQFSTLGLVPYYVLHFLLVFIVGLPIAVRLVQRWKLPGYLTVMMAILVSSLIGYAAFWLYFFNSVVGYGFSVAVLLWSGWQVWQLHRQQRLVPLLHTRDVILPLLLMFAVGLAYLALLYVNNPGETAAELIQTRFLSGSMPPDNVLPKLFADRLFAGKDPRQIFGDWLSSDRPPLQAGIILFQRPVMALTGNIGFHYQLLGTILQCSWIPALWALCRTVQLSGRQQAIVLAFSIFSGFFLFNSLYLWPKLLAAAFTILALAVLLHPIYESRRPTVPEAVLATSAAALGMLSHGGVVFTLPAIALMLVLRPSYLWGVRPLLIGCAVYVLLMAPWSAYQKLYDPPGDRLVKLHLAGLNELDKQSRSSLQAIFDSYQKLTPPEILNNKWKNVETLANNPYSDLELPSRRRAKEFFHVIPGLSILNVGWLVLLVTLFQRKPSKVTRRAQGLMAIAAFSILFWVLVMFGPSTTVIHQGSYATMMLLFASLAMLLTQLPQWLCYALLSLQILLFTYDWIVTASFGFGTQIMIMPNLWMFGLMLLSWLAVFVLLRRVASDRLSMESKYATDINAVA